MLQRKLQGITCWLIHGDVQWVCGNRGATCKTINFKSSDHSYILETRQKFKLCPSHPCLYPEVTAGDYSPTIFFQEPVSTQNTWQIKKVQRKRYSLFDQDKVDTQYHVICFNINLHYIVTYAFNEFSHFIRNAQQLSPSCRLLNDVIFIMIPSLTQ